MENGLIWVEISLVCCILLHHLVGEHRTRRRVLAYGPHHLFFCNQNVLIVSQRSLAFEDIKIWQKMV